jgi:6-phosphogluconolactonase (cycloisomerase 2 family)
MARTGRFRSYNALQAPATPRNFAIDASGSWLFAANQKSNTFSYFALTPALAV